VTEGIPLDYAYHKGIDALRMHDFYAFNDSLYRLNTMNRKATKYVPQAETKLRDLKRETLSLPFRCCAKSRKVLSNQKITGLLNVWVLIIVILL